MSSRVSARNSNWTKLLIVIMFALLLTACKVSIVSPTDEGPYVYGDSIHFKAEYNGTGEIKWKSDYHDQFGNELVVTHDFFESNARDIGKGFPWDFEISALPPGNHRVIAYKNTDMTDTYITITSLCDTGTVDCSDVGDGICTYGLCNYDNGHCDLMVKDDGTECSLASVGGNSLCEENYQCVEGQCVGTPVVCDAGMICTEQFGCTYEDDPDCDDNMPCTYDYASNNGVCIHQPMSDRCEDGYICDSTEGCIAGSCTTSAECDYLNSECAAGFCNPDTHACEANPYPDCEHSAEDKSEEAAEHFTQTMLSEYTRLGLYDPEGGDCSNNPSCIDPMDLFNPQSTKSGNPTVITQETVWDSNLGTCPSNPVFETLILDNNSTLYINGCEITITKNLLIGNGTVDARGTAGNETTLNIGGSIAMWAYGYPDTWAYLKTSYTNINIDGLIWLWAGAKWHAAREEGFDGPTHVKPYTARYWAGIALWGNYSQTIQYAVLGLTNTTLENALFAINVSIWDNQNQMWWPAYAKVDLENVDVVNCLAQVSAHSWDHHRTNTYNFFMTHKNVQTYNTDQSWFDYVYETFEWEGPNRPWWAYHIKGLDYKIDKLTITESGDNHSTIDWLLTPIRLDDCESRFHFTHNTFTRRANVDGYYFMALYRLEAQAIINNNKFYDATPSSEQSDRRRTINISMNYHSGEDIEEAIQINDNLFGSDGNGNYEFNGPAGIYLGRESYGEELLLPEFTVKVLGNQFWCGKTTGLDVIYITTLGDAMHNDFRGYVYVNDNVIDTRYEVGFRGIEVANCRFAQFNGNILKNQYDNADRTWYINGICSRANAEAQISNNLFDGYFINQGAWIEVSHGHDMTEDNITIWGNRMGENSESNGRPFLSLETYGMPGYYCPPGVWTIGYDPNGTCVGNDSGSLAMTANCQGTTAVRDCD